LTRPDSGAVLQTRPEIYFVDHHSATIDYTVVFFTPCALRSKRSEEEYMRSV